MSRYPSVDVTTAPRVQLPAWWSPNYISVCATRAGVHSSAGDQYPDNQRATTHNFFVIEIALKYCVNRYRSTEVSFFPFSRCVCAESTMPYQPTTVRSKQPHNVLIGNGVPTWGHWRFIRCRGGVVELTGSLRRAERLARCTYGNSTCLLLERLFTFCRRGVGWREPPPW